MAPQHVCCAKAYELIAGELRPDHMIACKLCAFETVDRAAALGERRSDFYHFAPAFRPSPTTMTPDIFAAHLQSLQHGQNVSRWVSCDGPTDEIFVTRRLSDGGAADTGWYHLHAINCQWDDDVGALCAAALEGGGELKGAPPSFR